MSYGGYEIDRGIVDDFYQMKIEESESFVWKKVILSKENEVLPGIYILLNFRFIKKTFSSNIWWQNDCIRRTTFDHLE